MRAANTKVAQKPARAKPFGPRVVGAVERAAEGDDGKQDQDRSNHRGLVHEEHELETEDDHDDHKHAGMTP
jgi:ABC-type Zn2+ transport system substrate-binding protein/surface adhesin